MKSIQTCQVTVNARIIVADFFTASVPASWEDMDVSSGGTIFGDGNIILVSVSLVSLLSTLNPVVTTLLPVRG